MNNHIPKYLTSRYGPMVIDARQPFDVIEIAIDGPKMRINGLQLVTSLSLIQGNEMSALKLIKNGVEGVVMCGHTNDVEVDIKIESNILGPLLTFDVGPMGMYTSTMMLKTKSGVTFKELMDHQFATFAGEVGLPTDYIACFLVIPGTGKHGGSGHMHNH